MGHLMHRFMGNNYFVFATSLCVQGYMYIQRTYCMPVHVYVGETSAVKAPFFELKIM